MLIFARKKDQWIDIDDDIQICVISITGNKVRIGINAPRGTVVNRREVTLKIAEAKEPSVLLCQPQHLGSAQSLLAAQKNE